MKEITSGKIRQFIIRLLFVIAGIIVMGIGISIFKFATLGNDPYTGMLFAMADALNFPYPWLQVIVGGILFLIQLFLDRHTIGAGSVINVFGIGFVIDFFNGIIPKLVEAPEGMPFKLLTVAIGMLLCSLGISLYQEASLGISPYDSLSVIAADKQDKLPYFWCRIITDAICAIVCFALGGIIGIGTIVTAFGFGPFVSFYNKYVSDPALRTLITEK